MEHLYNCNHCLFLLHICIFLVKKTHLKLTSQPYIEQLPRVNFIYLNSLMPALFDSNFIILQGFFPPSDHSFVL